jgi:hypothetical protein
MRQIRTILSRRDGALLVLALVAAFIIEWALGTACTTPQMIHEVQTAEPLPEGANSVNVSGGISWTPTYIWSTAGEWALGATNIPNADLSLLVRHSLSQYREFQVPINLSLRVAPGSDEPEGWFWMQFSTGPLWKHSAAITKIEGSDTLSPGREGRPFYWRPLYSANLYGPRIGAIVTNSDMFLNTAGYIQKPLAVVLPYAGFYFKHLTEHRHQGHVGFSGLQSGINVYYLTPDLWTAPLAGVEASLAGLAGCERERFVFQFTYGAAWQVLFGAKLFLGATFTAKPTLKAGK